MKCSMNPKSQSLSSKIKGFFKVGRAQLLAIGAMALLNTGIASASTVYDFAFAHGATGLLLIGADGTFTSNCLPLPGYPDAQCPSAAGTWTSNGQFLYLLGNNGVQVDYQIVGQPGIGVATELTQISNSYDEVILTKGTVPGCLNFNDSIRNLGPIVYSNSKGQYFLSGSNQSVGSNVWSTIAIKETKPGYFVKGICP